MTRIDMVCCLDNKPLSSYDYYLIEIEEGGKLSGEINHHDKGNKQEEFKDLKFS